MAFASISPQINGASLMGGLIIKSIREAAALNGTSAELNWLVTGAGLLLFTALVAVFCFWCAIRLAKWAWTHA